MTFTPSLTAERRRADRTAPPAAIHVAKAVPVRTLFDVKVLNVSGAGVALCSPEPLPVGERLRFTTGADQPPILAEVLQCAALPEGSEHGQGFHVRCRCLMGGFDTRG
jgi:hypothetical protein